MRYLSFDPAVKNLGYAILEISDDDVISNLYFGLIDLCPKKKVKSCSFDSLMESLFAELGKIKTENCDEVLIECQPAMKNPLCKSISIAIYSYFTLKGIKSKLVNAGRKLGTAGKKLTYAQKKAESVKKCLELVSLEDKQKIEKYKKKSDITDAILQIIAYNRGKK